MSRVWHGVVELLRIVLPVAILAIGVGGFWVFGRPPEVARRERAGDEPALVETSEVVAHEDLMVIDVDGVAVPYRQITLAAEVSGRVTRKADSGRAGSYVEPGEFLIRIDDTNYALEVARFEQELKQSEEELRSADVDISNAKALIELAEEDLALRKRELARRTKLLATSAISESELDESRRLELSSRNSLRTLVNQLASHEQRKRTLEAARELKLVQSRRARTDLERTQVVSPIAGTVSAEFVEQDDYVKLGDPLLRLSDAGTMEVKCSLRVEELYWIWLQSSAFRGEASGPESLFEIPATAVHVVFEFEGREYVWDGILSRYEGTGLDAQTRMVPCRVRVDHPTRVRGSSSSTGDFRVPALFTGMYVTVRIPIDAPIPLLRLPPAALRPGPRVWVMEDGELTFESVDVALSGDEGVIVRRPAGGTLRPGAKVITSPLANVREGMAVAEEVPGP